MVQGGYVSPSSAKTLTVNKKSNVLNKIPPRGPKGSATNNSNATNNNNNTTIGSSIDVSKCRCYFLLVWKSFFLPHDSATSNVTLSQNFIAFRNDKKSKLIFFYFTFMELLLIGTFIDDETRGK